jgi:Tfp pilus assembly protein PilX
MNRQRGQTLLIALLLLLALSILTLGNLRSGLLLDNSLAESRDYQAALGGADSAISEALDRTRNSPTMAVGEADTCVGTAQNQQQVLLCDRLWLEPDNAASSALLPRARTYRGNDLASPDQLAELSSAPRWYVAAQCESRSSSAMADCLAGNGTLLLQMNALSTGITDQALVRLQEYARVQR